MAKETLVGTELIKFWHNPAMNLSDLDKSTKEKVLRLLDRESYNLQNPVRKESKRWFIFIDPMSFTLLAWNFLFLIVFYGIQLQLSLSIGFGPEFVKNDIVNSVYRGIYIAYFVFLLVDIFFSFFKGYYAFGRGKIIDQGWEVFFHYLISQFPFDIVVAGIFLIPLFYSQDYVNLLQLIPIILLWIKKEKIQNQIQYKLQYRPLFRSILVVLLLFSDALIFGNYGTCVFILMDKQMFKYSFYGDSTSSAYYWLINNTAYPISLMNGSSLNFGPWWEAYVYGQFFSTGTLSTLAPGPFAKNPIEAGYAIFLMIFFMIYASYLADVIVQVVYTYSQVRLIHEEKILQFQNFMKLKEVHSSIRYRVFNYFELKWQLEYKSESRQQKLMIDKLPLYLKEELLQEIGFSRQIPFLRYFPDPEEFSKQIALNIQRSTADANTCIFQSHRLEVQRERCLFFVKDGFAQLYLDKTITKEGGYSFREQPILNLTNNDRLLGIYEFVTGQDYSVCCKSIDLCLIQSLTFIAFEEILEQLKIKELFKKFQYRILIEREMDLIKKRCVVCAESHIQTDCPELYYSRKIENQIKEGPEYKENIRRKFERRNINSEKKIGQLRKLRESNIFNILKPLKLDKVFTELISIQKSREVAIDQVENLVHFYPEFNIRVPNQQNQSSF